MLWKFWKKIASEPSGNMDKIFKLVGTFLVLSLAALPLNGCDSPPWESGRVLNLKVDTPKQGATLTTSTITVGGRVTGTQAAEARVTVNDSSVSLKDNKFSSSVTLTQGTNVLNIAASSSSGATLKETVTVTYAPAK